jgi:hypothetical protein
LARWDGGIRASASAVPQKQLKTFGLLQAAEKLGFSLCGYQGIGFSRAVKRLQ